MLKKQIVLAGAGAAAALALLGYVAVKRAGLDLTADAVNPLSRDNLVAKGVNAAGAAITGDEYFTVGGMAFDAIELLKKPFWFLSGEPDLAAPSPAGRDTALTRGRDRAQVELERRGVSDPWLSTW